MAHTKLDTGSAIDSLANGERCVKNQFLFQQQWQNHYHQQQQLPREYPEMCDHFDEHETTLFKGPRRQCEDIDCTILFTVMDNDLDNEIEAVV